MEELKVIINAATNLGGMGLLGLALFVLHRESLRAFRDEMKEARAQFAQALDDWRTQVLSLHSQGLAKLDQVLDRLRHINGTFHDRGKP